MSYNGSGTFVINSSGQPVVTGTVISSTVFNAFTADIATGLSTAICKDGQTTLTGNIPFNSNRITGLGAGTARTDAIQYAQVQDGAITYLTSVSGTNTVTATGAASLSAYATGQEFTFIPANTNTGATTLNINSIGAKNVFAFGSACVGGELKSGSPARVQYDGTQFNILSNGPGKVLQVVSTASAAVDTSTTIIPVDDSIPQNTEGEEWSALNTSITPKSSTSKLVIEITIAVVSCNSANEDVAFGLFQDSTANALAAFVARSSTTNAGNSITYRHVMTSGTTSATTFKVRYGPTAGTATVNGINTARLFGGVGYSSLTITEVTQ